MSRKASPALREARQQIATLKAQLNEYIAIVGGYPDGDLIISQQETIFALEQANATNQQSVKNAVAVIEHVTMERDQARAALKELTDAEIAKREAANQPRRRNTPAVELVEAVVIDEDKLGVEGVIYKLDGKVFKRPAGGLQGFANKTRIMTDEAGRTLLPRTLVATLEHA